MLPANINTRDVNGCVAVEILGELDVANSLALEKYLAGVFKKFPQGVILDMSGVNYIASSGLAALISILRKSKETRVPFAICCLTPFVRQSLEVTNLRDVLPIYKDCDSASRDIS